MNAPRAHNGTGRRVLFVSAVFPPDTLGGAEMSAREQALWLQRQGVEVGVLTTAKTPEEACEGVEEDGLKIWRVWMPRPYPMFYYAHAKWWQKPLWHLQDHIDPRNRRIAARVFDAFRPDHINIHVLQGLGYNIMKEIGRRGIPVTYFLHDLALACFRMTMYRKGKNCETQCAPCKLSSACKAKCADKIENLTFCSPSQANMDTLARFFPIRRRRHTAILNANKYPAPTVTRADASKLRFLYVGRLQESKGISLALERAAELAKKYDFSFTVIGTGPDEERLRAKYAETPWCRFTGFIPQKDVSNHIVNSDVLLTPSIWAENSPGVVIHALGLGLPVIASDTGGIPELVEHGKNGLLVPPGDAKAWHAAMEGLLENPGQLASWRNYANDNAHRFDQDYLGRATMDFMFGTEG